MPVQFKLDHATGEISDVKLVRMPRDVRAYNETYYARTKTFRTCEFCNKAVSNKSIYQHQKIEEVLSSPAKEEGRGEAEEERGEAEERGRGEAEER